MSKIKLLKVDEIKNGTIRLQSQLMAGRDSVDFIIEDGILKNWGHKDGNLGFHKTDVEYEIVESKKEMMYQPL